MRTTHRALVLGATGFLGSAVVKALLEKNVNVSVVVRGHREDSEFARLQFDETVAIAGGVIEDISRLRQIIAIHEIDSVYQCAAGATAGATHALTDFAMQAVATSERRPPLIVPLSSRTNSIRFQAKLPVRLNVAFVTLPDLFGPGNLHYGRFTSEIFMNAVMQRPLPLAQPGLGVIDVNSAASELVKASGICEESFVATGHEIRVEPLATGHDLTLAVKAIQAGNCGIGCTGIQKSIRSTFEWYRSTEARWFGRMSQPALKAAA